MMMAHLKLGALIDDRPVKMTVELPAAVHRDLLAYAALHAAEHGQDRARADRLVAPILAQFMADDREFARARRDGRNNAASGG
jgi:hypothetical protein